MEISLSIEVLLAIWTLSALKEKKFCSCLSDCCSALLQWRATVFKLCEAKGFQAPDRCLLHGRDRRCEFGSWGYDGGSDAVELQVATVVAAAGAGAARGMLAAEPGSGGCCCCWCYKRRPERRRLLRQRPNANCCYYLPLPWDRKAV